MEPRFDLFANELGAKISKRLSNVSLAIQQSPLPRPTQELVMLRVSRINGCGFCVDYHTKGHGRRGDVGPVALGRRVARDLGLHRGRAGRTGTRRGGDSTRRRPDNGPVGPTHIRARPCGPPRPRVVPNPVSLQSVALVRRRGAPAWWRLRSACR